MEKPIIGITMGDAAGVGPEIIAKAFLNNEVHSICRPLVIGDTRVMRQGLKFIKSFNLSINPVKSVSEAKFTKGIIDVYDLENLDPAKIKIGQVNPSCGRAAVEYLKRAIDMAMGGRSAA